MRPNILRLSLSTLAALLLICVSTPADFAQTAPASPTPISIAIIFDLSSSAASSRQSPVVKPKELEKLLSTLFTLGTRNQYFVISVSTRPAVILDGSTEQKAALEALSKLASERREGATALYDACYLGVEKVSREEHSKRVLLVVSDGVDTISTTYLDEVLSALTENEVRLYAIHVGNPKDKTYSRGAGVLDEMASTSGGRAFRLERSEDLDAILESIAAKLRE